MGIPKARLVSESERNEMTAEALALAFEPGASLDKRVIVEAMAATLESLGNPLARVWIEGASGKRYTYDSERALAYVSGGAEVRNIWAIPESERGNSKARWLTAATLSNLETTSTILFFGLPQGLAKEFAPHLTLLKRLVQSAVVPRYGFGYVREYGLGPDYYSVGYAYRSGAAEIDQNDWTRLTAWSNDIVGDPTHRPDRYRHARGLILDVFPMNVLSDTHLRQQVDGLTLREWILANTGPESLLEIGPTCSCWFVPPARRVEISARLDEFGLIIASPLKRIH
jgi:hypothetical protein